MAAPERKVPAAQASREPIEVLEDLLTSRYSCRAFKAEPVPRNVIERLLTAAQRTASWCNSQPWQVVITSDAETKKFRDVMYAAATSGEPEAPDFPWPREYKDVYLERRRESGFQLYNTLGIPRGDRAAYAKQALENYNFFGAPHVAIITTAEELGVYGAVDCGLYVDTFMLAAQALGLGTIAQAALARRSDVVRKYFNVADDRRVVCGISFGYPDHGHIVNSYRTSRAKLDDAVRFVGE
jgi:nitroreductase